MVISIILLIVLLIGIVTDIVYVHTKNKYISLMEKQNELLWVVLKESNDISKELIKINLKENGGSSNEKTN